MSPLRPRYSIKTYVGKKKAKPKFSYLQDDDLFEKLLQGEDKTARKSNIFQSSSEFESSSLSRTGTEVSGSEKQQNSFNFSPVASVAYYRGIFKGTGSINKRNNSNFKPSIKKILKKINKNEIIEKCNDQYEIINSSTPKLQTTGRRFRSSKSDLISVIQPPLSTTRSNDDFLRISSFSPIFDNNTLLDTGQKRILSDTSISDNSISKDDSSIDRLTPDSSQDTSTSSRKCEKDFKEVPSMSLLFEAAKSESCDELKSNDDVATSEGADPECDQTKSSICLSFPTSPASDSPCKTDDDRPDEPISSSGSDSNIIVPELSCEEISNLVEPVQVVMDKEPYKIRKSERIQAKKTSKTPITGLDSTVDSLEPNSISDISKFHQRYLNFIRESPSNSESKYNIEVKLRGKCDELCSNDEKSPQMSNDDKLARLSLVDSSVSSSDRITMRRRRNLNQFKRPVIDEPYFLEGSPQSTYPVRRTDIDRRRIYQRLSRSLPASFKDSSPLLFERGCVSDIDLRRSKKMLSRMRDDPSSNLSLNCSTRSLPAVLEDQDQESSNDEESQSSRCSFPYRKSSFDQNHSTSPLFLGFSTAELGKRRSFVKKHSDDSSCTSPHTLPVLPENDSDSSCESGDDSKRLESGSSSQMESPVMSPGVQGSPSRRDNSRISASYSSETSLSSRSEGMLSPLQEDSVTPPRSSSPEFTAASSEEDSGSSPIKKEDQIRRRRPSRLTSKRTLGYIAEESESDTSELTHLPDSKYKGFFLLSGKKYRRSLAIIQHHILRDETFSYENKGKNYLETVDTVKQLQKEDMSHFDSDDSSDLSPDSRKFQSFNKTCLSKLSSKFSTTINPDDPSHSSFDSKSVSFRTVLPRSSNRYSSTVFCVNSNLMDVSEAFSRFSLAPSDLSARIEESGYTPENAILSLSDQDKVKEFREIFADGSLSTWKKIGEGVYSEVFSISRKTYPPSVLKIIPVDGDVIVNGCTQMTLNDNLSEVLISKFLSELRREGDNSCDGFVLLLKVWYVQGQYPEELIKLWNDFNENYGSDNDRPTVYPTNQNYLCLELANSGKALESYTFSTAKQSFSIFKQVAFSLAIAENLFEFEHRDLHWGNILVDKTKEKTIDYMLNGEHYSLLTNGVKSTIIDYTWSSMTCEGSDNIRLVNDMEQDPDLFEGKGDLQFDIYRQMREDVEQNWTQFRPKTNVRWLYYLADKLLFTSKYQRSSTATHKDSLNSFQKIKELIPTCDNSLQVAIELLSYK